MRYSRNGYIFTACREALVTVAYPDGPNHSIGIGSNDPTLKPGDTITVKEAFERLKRDIAAREVIVNRALKVEVSQQQFDAITDLYFQNGNKLDIHGRRGFDAVMALVNVRQFAEAAAYLPNVCLNSKGVKIKGLRDRRVMEQAIFLRGDYGNLSTIPLYRGDPHVVPQERYAIQTGDI